MPIVGKIRKANPLVERRGAERFVPGTPVVRRGAERLVRGQPVRARRGTL